MIAPVNTYRLFRRLFSNQRVVHCFTRRNLPWFSISLLLLLYGVIIPGVRTEPAIDAGLSTTGESAGFTTQQMSRLPLSFVPNAGQRDGAVHYEARAMGGDLYFTEQGVVLALPVGTSGDTAGDGVRQRTRGKDKRLAERAAAGITVVRLQFEGANAKPALEPGAALPGVVNYLLGNDPDQWRTGLSTYEGIHYRDLYPGIDLAYDGTQGVLKGTYTVAPGVDPAQIRWRYEGASDVRVDGESGELLITLADNGSVLAEQAPVAWQQREGERVPVAVRYAIAADGSIGFMLAGYDSELALIIDPALVYSTYLGGNHTDTAYEIAVDAAGSVYITGVTASIDFPIVNAVQPTCAEAASGYCNDVFVTKLSADGQSVIYSTYLGGTSAENNYQINGNYQLGGIAVDLAGNAYVTGNTTSTDFPTVNPFQPDCALSTMGYCRDTFVAKLATDGQSLIYSTYLGGTHFDDGSGIDVDSAGNAYITGITQSVDFPTANAFQASCTLGFGGACGDAFVTKLAADGQSLLYSSFLGGTVGEFPYGGIAVDSAGNAYVVGYTSSSDFPVVNALQPTCRPSGSGACFDAFLTKVSADGRSLAYSTYFGGSGSEHTFSATVDGAGNLYVTGITTSTDLPIANAFQGSCRLSAQGVCTDAFVLKMAENGQSLVYSTYLGGSSEYELSLDIAVDRDGHAYVTGSTASIDWPTVDAFQSECALAENGGCGDAFVTKLAANGQSLVYSTYLGGSSGEQANGIAVDAAGNAYVTGITGSLDFPTASPMQAQCAEASSGYCGDFFVTKLEGDGAACSLPSSNGLPAEPGASSAAISSPAQAVSGRVLWGPAYQELVNTGVAQATVTLGCVETTTDNEGRFSVDVEPGTYPLSIRYALFEDHQAGADTLAAAWVEKEVSVTIESGTTQLAPVTGFGDLVKLEVLGQTTEVDAELTSQGFTGSADLPFGDDPAQPLKINVAYTRANNRLDLTANGQSTLTLGGQSVTITTFAYSSPSNTGSLGGFGTILGRPARLGGTVNKSEITGTVDLCFARDTRAEADQACFISNPPEAPLHAALSYTLASRQLALTASNASQFSWYGQTVQLQTFSYSYPANALTLEANAQLDINGLQATMQIRGEMSGQTLLLEASGDAIAQDVTVRFDTLRLTASAFVAQGRVWLPGQTANDDNQPPPIGTFDTSFASGTSTISLALQGFQFAGYPATVTLHITTNPLVVRLAGSGQAMIGGQVSNITIESTINTGTDTLAARATLTIAEGSAELSVQYNWLTGAFSANGTLIYRTQPCPGQPPVSHTATVVANNNEIQLSGTSTILVECSGQRLIVFVQVSYRGGVAQLQAGIPVLINGAPGTIKFVAWGDGSFVELRLLFEWRFGGGTPGWNQPFPGRPQSDEVRVLLTDSFGRRIGYDAASGQIVNEVPGATYDGIVNGVDSFTLPGMVGGYLVRLSSERDTSVVMQAQVPDGNASASYAVTLEAGKTTTLIVGMAPDEDGVIQVGLAPFQYLLYLPAING